MVNLLGGVCNMYEADHAIFGLTVLVVGHAGDTPREIDFLRGFHISTINPDLLKVQFLLYGPVPQKLIFLGFSHFHNPAKPFDHKTFM